MKLRKSILKEVLDLYSCIWQALIKPELEKMLSIQLKGMCKRFQSNLKPAGKTSDVARAFPGGQVAHPERQNEEENK